MESQQDQEPLPVVIAAGRPPLLRLLGGSEIGARAGRARRALSKRPALLRSAALATAAIVLATGTLGAYRYARSYYLYRGFAAPAPPAYTFAVRTHRPVASRRAEDRLTRVPVLTGITETINVWSPALGGQWVKTMVFLPPGYQRSSTTRYPVLYWLHGLHSQGFSLLTVTGAAADEDVLVAQKRIKPLIIVIPSGGWRLDTEWADGVAPNSSWETFVARDLTRAIDQRFRTIATRAGRAIGGLSEGGYGALNIALHHPDTFGFVESWSGYTIADPTSHVFGTDQRRLDYNSPLYEVSAVAPTLIRNHDYFWFYVGNEDPYRAQNAAFAAALTRLGVPHGYFSVRGVHSWRLWRRFMVESLLVLSAHVSDVTA